MFHPYGQTHQPSVSLPAFRFTRHVMQDRLPVEEPPYRHAPLPRLSMFVLFFRRPPVTPSDDGAPHMSTPFAMKEEQRLSKREADVLGNSEQAARQQDKDTR